MKKLMITVVLLCAMFNVFSQTVGDTPIKDIETTYIQIVGTQKMLANKVVIQIDFGQKASIYNDKTIKDENGKDVIFNSMIDALNFFYDSGYEFINAYSITANNQNVYNYILKKIGK